MTIIGGANYAGFTQPVTNDESFPELNLLKCNESAKKLNLMVWQMS